MSRFRKQPKYVPIVIKEELTPADLAFVDSHRDFFPELVKIEAQSRLYPQNGMLAHVIGYTGEISEAELDLPEFAKNNPGDVVGKIRHRKASTTTGSPASMASGRWWWTIAARCARCWRQGVRCRARTCNSRSISTCRPWPSSPWTIPARSEVGVERKNGAVVALDPRTGEVLAMVSRPTFDPNKFAVRIKPKDWKEIIANPDNPLLNRALQAQQAPGSTFKPIVALAGLETGSIDENFTVHCAGATYLYGRLLHCHKTHGAVSLHRGIAQSCDVVLLQRRHQDRHRQPFLLRRYGRLRDSKPASTCRTRPRA